MLTTLANVNRTHFINQPQAYLWASTRLKMRFWLKSGGKYRRLNPLGQGSSRFIN